MKRFSCFVLILLCFAGCETAEQKAKELEEESPQIASGSKSKAVSKKNVAVKQLNSVRIQDCLVASGDITVEIGGYPIFSIRNEKNKRKFFQYLEKLQWTEPGVLIGGGVPPDYYVVKWDSPLRNCVLELANSLILDVEDGAFITSNYSIEEIKELLHSDTELSPEEISNFLNSSIIRLVKLANSEKRVESLSNYQDLGAEKKEEAVAQPKLDSAEAYYKRGLNWFENKDFNKAIADYTDAIRLNPKYAVAFSYRGNAKSYLGEHDKAIKDCNEAIRLNSKLAVAYVHRGLAWVEKSEIEKCISDCNEVTCPH